MKLDQGITRKDVQRAVTELKRIRGKTETLDRLVDSIKPTRVAHVAEEALRVGAIGGLWRYSGSDSGLISDAIARLNSWVPRPGRPARTHFQSGNGLQPIPTPQNRS